MIVYFDESPAGTGKTFRAINRMIREAGRYIFVTERIEQLSEVKKRIANNPVVAGRSPLIHQIDSRRDNRGGSVAIEISRLPDTYRSVCHVIVLITHAALLRADFDDFAGWEIIIDEVPPFLDFEEKTTHLDEAFFSRHYELHELSAGWSAITLSDEGRTVSTADVRADQSHAHLRVFHSRVIEASALGSKRAVLTNLRSWTEMSGRKVKWCWASVFSLRNLETFDRVELLGNRFRQDVGALITQWLDGSKVEWRALPPLSTSRTFVHRDVRIGYFSD